MPKRKRDDIEDVLDRIEDRALRTKAHRLKARIDQGNQKLKNAIQLAKGFERQKLGRRQKQASEKPHTLLRLREEVIIIKELEPGNTAKEYLFKQLAKTRRIRESPAFVALYGDNPDVAGPKSTSEGNVLGRLIKSNPVKEILPNVLAGIREVLGLDQPESSAQPLDGYAVTPKDNDVSGNKHLDAGSREEIDEVEDGSEPHGEAIVSRLPDFGSHALHHNVEVESVGTDYDDLIASVNDSETESMESGNHGKDQNLGEARRSTSASAHADSISDRSPISDRPQKISTTTFLPALTLGGYYSGDSDSEVNSFDPDPARIQPLRKNRRGQRARQQLAEAKYGKMAKHLAKTKEPGEAISRSAVWDVKRGAVGSQKDRRKGDSGKYGTPRQLNDDRSKSRTDGQVKKHFNNNKAKPDALIHPSWAAARKRKQEFSTASFSGKKIIFD